MVTMITMVRMVRMVRVVIIVVLAAVVAVVCDIRIGQLIRQSDCSNLLYTLFNQTQSLRNSLTTVFPTTPTLPPPTTTPPTTGHQ